MKFFLFDLIYMIHWGEIDRLLLHGTGMMSLLHELTDT